MTPIAQDLFAQARELPAAERDAFLAQACGDILPAIPEGYQVPPHLSQT